jgi:hypothetical protein
MSIDDPHKPQENPGSLTRPAPGGAIVPHSAGLSTRFLNLLQSFTLSGAFRGPAQPPYSGFCFQMVQLGASKISCMNLAL